MHQMAAHNISSFEICSTANRLEELTNRMDYMSDGSDRWTDRRIQRLDRMGRGQSNGRAGWGGREWRELSINSVTNQRADVESRDVCSAAGLRDLSDGRGLGQLDEDDGSEGQGG